MAAAKSFHDTHSNTYDRMAGNCTLSVATIVLADLPVPITPDSYILDNACGSGLVTSILKASHPFARIHGADLAPGMISIYSDRVSRHSWENITSEVLDVRDLKTIKDETFTHVVTNFGFAPDVADLQGPLRAAKEMYRVLKPGGVAIVTTWAGMWSHVPFFFSMATFLHDLRLQNRTQLYQSLGIRPAPSPP